MENENTENKKQMDCKLFNVKIRTLENECKYGELE